MARERRAHPRFPLVLAVQYLGAESALDYTENLSADGLFLRTERQFKAGEKVKLVLFFPQIVEPVEIEVEVVRLRAEGVEGPAGVAVRVHDANLVDSARSWRTWRAGSPPPASRWTPARGSSSSRTTTSSPRCTRRRSAASRRPTT